MSQLFGTPFGRYSTASEVIDGVDLSGKRAIVTGAGSGIGTETTRVLAFAGAEVVLAVRPPRQPSRSPPTSPNPPATRSRRAPWTCPTRIPCAADWKRPLHILVNNAGVIPRLGLPRIA
jgi:NAD(P)-dependent dehydrogenase (short-subunit alcohol dehydrogenase family)